MDIKHGTALYLPFTLGHWGFGSDRYSQQRRGRREGSAMGHNIAGDISGPELWSGARIVGPPPPLPDPEMGATFVRMTKYRFWTASVSHIMIGGGVSCWYRGMPSHIGLAATSPITLECTTCPLFHPCPPPAEMVVILSPLKSERRKPGCSTQYRPGRRDGWMVSTRLVVPFCCKRLEPQDGFRGSGRRI